MIQRCGSVEKGATDPDNRASGAPGQGEKPERDASYAAALAAASTPQERTFVSLMELEHERLSRPPTVRELKAALSGSPLEGLSKDRLVQIKRNLVGQMQEGVEPIRFTKDRPLFRYLNEVRAEYERFVRENRQPPTFRKLKQLLAEACTPVTDTSLSNILKRLRRDGVLDGKSFRVSRQRIPVTTAQIVEAHGEATKYLAQVGVTKAPPAALVCHFLRRAKCYIGRQTLEYRFKQVRELKSLKLSAHFDSGDAVVTRAHKRLLAELGRHPTAKELASEYNRIALRKASPDGVWMRVSRLNRERSPKKRMFFSDTFASGIYDVDLRKAAETATARLKRAPTLKELRSALSVSVPGSDISLDALHRRSRRLGVHLTSEHDLTKDAQMLVALKIEELIGLFGRRPFGAEVREALSREGANFSQREFNSTLGAAKRYRGADFRAAVRLGFPGHLAGKLRAEYEALRRSGAGYPDAKQLAERLGWTVAGVESALPVAQARATRYRLSPVVLSNTPQAEALVALEALVQELGRSLAEGTSRPSGISDAGASAIKSMAGGWTLPGLAVGAEGSSLSFDQKLVRFEQWWVLITCLQSPPIQVSEDQEIEARCAEAMLARALGVKQLEDNPLEGFIQVLRIAQASGRISAGDFTRITTEAEKSPSLAAAYAGLRSELQNLARQCGFPQLRSAGKARKRPLMG